jgi:hypothetical protein
MLYAKVGTLTRCEPHFACCCRLGLQTWQRCLPSPRSLVRHVPVLGPSPHGPKVLLCARPSMSVKPAFLNPLQKALCQDSRAGLQPCIDHLGRLSWLSRKRAVSALVRSEFTSKCLQNRLTLLNGTPQPFGKDLMGFNGQIAGMRERGCRWYLGLLFLGQGGAGALLWLITLAIRRLHLTEHRCGPHGCKRGAVWVRWLFYPSASLGFMTLCAGAGAGRVCAGAGGRVLRGCRGCVCCVL